MTERLIRLHDWLKSPAVNMGDYEITPASADASFRRYFRLHTAGKTFIVMDAPPDKENCIPFVGIANALLELGLHVPEIYHQDLEQGFILLSDLGEQQYLQVLNNDNVERLYGDALSALMTLQASVDVHYDFPLYDEDLLISEMNLFRDWLLQKHLGLQLTNEQSMMLSKTFLWLSESALQQPQVPVHRDYHSRNLMFLSGGHNPGIIDFQDAVIGPVTYDLVSLLRDCYIEWPRQQVEDWVKGYHEQVLQSGIISEKDELQFLRWFDLMGVQRHLKAAGIFARLNHRDGKSDYLNDIPRTLGYITDVSSRYPELQELNTLLKEISL